MSWVLECASVEEVETCNMVCCTLSYQKWAISSNFWDSSYTVEMWNLVCKINYYSKTTLHTLYIVNNLITIDFKITILCQFLTLVVDLGVVYIYVFWRALDLRRMGFLWSMYYIFWMEPFYFCTMCNLSDSLFYYLQLNK